MSAPGKPSRWGSLLSQAVAGVEARLDNILADNDDVAPAKSPPLPKASPTGSSPSATQSAKASPGMFAALFFSAEDAVRGC